MTKRNTTHEKRKILLEQGKDSQGARTDLLSITDKKLEHNTPLAYPFYCMSPDTKKDRPDLKIHDGLVDYRRPTALPRAGMDTSHAYATALMVPRSPPNRQRRRLTTRQSNTQGRL